MSADKTLINRGGTVVPLKPASRGGGSIRVLVAEGRALVRAGYWALLETADPITVVGAVACAGDAIALAAQTRPDVGLLDLALPGLDDTEATARTISHSAFGGVAVLVIAPSESDERVFAALRAGAVGVLGRDAEPAELIRGVYMLARGQALISADSVRRLLAHWPPHSVHGGPAEQPLTDLTDRERDVVALVGRGLSNAEIAKALVISPATAKTHVSRAMIKLGARHRAQLVVLAYENGLVQPHAAAPSPAAASAALARPFQRTELGR
jgi:DNA-binding NarL/FixJ family response regulator